MSSRTPGRTRIQDLWTKRVRNPDGTYARVPSKRNGRGLRWRREIIDDNGQPQSEAFGRRDDARLWLEKQSSARVTGTYIDPRLGKTTLTSFYREWPRIRCGFREPEGRWTLPSTRRHSVMCHSQIYDLHTFMPG